MLPLIPDAGKTEIYEQINTKPFLNNMLNVYKWGNIKNANHLDRQSADDAAMFTNMFNGLIGELITENKISESKKAVEKYYEVMPTKFYSMRHVMSSFYFTQNLYRLNDLNRANAFINKSADYMGKELNYLADVSESKNRLTNQRDIQNYLTYFGEMIKLTHSYNQNDLSLRLEKQYNQLLNRFSPFFNG